MFSGMSASASIPHVPVILKVRRESKGTAFLYTHHKGGAEEGRLRIQRAGSDGTIQLKICQEC